MKFAFVFPGQGSQSIGMMKGYADLPVVRETFAEASDILGQDFWAMANEGPAEDLNLTVNTQPLMLMAGVSAYRAWESLTGARPVFMAGHSLGEYSALVAAGCLTFADALSLVRFRAEVMQQSVPEGTGGMAAVLGLDDDKVRMVCDEVMSTHRGKSLEPANFNSPGQVVIAGHRDAVLHGMELAKAKGAKRAIMLPMSVPSHCSLMNHAAEKMQQRLEQVTLQSPAISILHNADVQSHTDAASIRNILVRQLCKPVRWTETIHALASAGVTHVVECGPGKVLSGLNKRIDERVQSLALTDSESLHQAASLLG
ncbi:MAG: Malonyl CoA-acyl carrier protein transacylase [Nitrosomonadaceae bacterium]|nr:ACP S-malonyltransferase [Nitrosospira sp.]MBI0413524.1 ACP S-malonyltransferase [Nitrosospira sp.]MCG3773100.1 Malonyl CoA-acyl carrier protein transacylase [Nitrosomonadaceae bacterium]MSQ44737.1 [acyl-carrier-protein] S-malonyltransferase [Nitrosomonadaceae bacterium]